MTARLARARGVPDGGTLAFAMVAREGGAAAVGWGREVVHGREEHTENLLGLTLDAAVPLWVDRLRRMPWAAVMERAGACAEVVGAKGDVLQFGGRGCAEAFNALAEGVAALSFCPGGVWFLGRHWEHAHPENAARKGG